MNSESEFKETEIGMIPKEWEISSIGAKIDLLTDYHANGSYKKLKENVSLKDEPDYAIMVRTTNFEKKDFSHNLKYIDKHAYNFLKKSKVFSDDILMNKIANAGSVYIMPDLGKPVSLAMNLFMLRMKKSVNQRFVFYYLKNHETYLKSFCQGTAAKTITKDNVRSFPLILPSFTEQNIISDILFNLDKKIELNHKMNQTLEEIGQNIFKQWFVHFEFPNEEEKPYKSNGGEMIDSKLGNIPQYWKIEKLENYVNTIKGCSYKSADLNESKNALVTLKSIGRDGVFKKNGFKEYSGNFKEDQLIVDGDVVIAQTDLTQKAEVLGKPVIVRSVPHYKKLIASLDLVIVRPKSEYFSKEFIYETLKTKTFHNHAVSYANGTTVLHLSKDAVPEYETAVPPKSIIDNFGMIIRPIFEKININNLESENITQIKDSLLPRLMSGKIRVPLEEK
jgi:type I restriction enzyme S subunit